MNELTTTNHKKKRTTIMAFTAMFIAAMFVAGYVIGGSLSSTATSSEIDKLQQQLGTLQNENNDEEIHTITYYYNTTSLGQLYNVVQDSVVVITGYIAQYTFFGIQYSQVQGSGFLYNSENHMVVITNQHVVDQTSNVTVTFSNGDAYPATVIGSDPYSDLAVLQLQAPSEDFKPLKIISSSSLQVGDPVIAIGSPFGLGGTMTTGIVSQLGRTIQDSTAGSYPIANIIQTSVPINPGNSGGPLLNYQGEVVGITTAIIQNSNGLGFAIPSNTILREINDLIATGSYNQHPWLGISGADMTYAIAKAMDVNVTYGWLITQLASGGAAEQAGLQAGNQQVRVNNERMIIGGDIIIAIDETRIINGDTLMTYLEEHTVPHQIITMTIVRNHQILTMPVELGQRPPIT